MTKSYFESKSDLLDPQDGQYLGSAGYRYLSIPETDRRLKPSDLFGSSTDRSVVSSDVTNSLYLAFRGDPTRDIPDTYRVLYAGTEYTADFQSAIEECRGKLLDKIKRQNVNLAQAMIEFRQSVDLFSSLATELITGYRALRKGRLPTKAFLSKDKTLSKKWIEYQFGILPLVSDLQGICDSLATKLREGIHIHVTQRGADTQQYSRTKPNSDAPGYVYQFENHMFKIRLQARYMIGDSFVDDVTRFGFSNAPALGWEMVPFSFVVDWMFGVGDWLGRLDALNGIKDLSLNQSMRTDVITETSTSLGGLATSNSVSKSRTTTQTSLPIGYPRYEPSFSLRRLMTASALLHLIRA